MFDEVQASLYYSCPVLVKDWELFWAWRWFISSIALYRAGMRGRLAFIDRTCWSKLWFSIVLRWSADGFPAKRYTTLWYPPGFALDAAAAFDGLPALMLTWPRMLAGSSRPFISGTSRLRGFRSVLIAKSSPPSEARLAVNIELRCCPGCRGGFLAPIGSTANMEIWWRLFEKLVLMRYSLRTA